MALRLAAARGILPFPYPDARDAPAASWASWRACGRRREAAAVPGVAGIGRAASIRRGSGTGCLPGARAAPGSSGAARRAAGRRAGVGRSCRPARPATAGRSTGRADCREARRVPATRSHALRGHVCVGDRSACSGGGAMSSWAIARQEARSLREDARASAGRSRELRALSVEARAQLRASVWERSAILREWRSRLGEPAPPWPGATPLPCPALPCPASK